MGLRPGDPLSPYLFILVANALSTLIHQDVTMGNIKGIQLTRSCPNLSHLFFADDAIFFIEGKLLECQNLSKILNQYCQALGQAINRNNSGIYFSRGYPAPL